MYSRHTPWLVANMAAMAASAVSSVLMPTVKGAVQSQTGALASPVPKGLKKAPQNLECKTLLVPVLHWDEPPGMET